MASRYGRGGRRGPQLDDPDKELTYKNPQLLWKFLTERGKIMPRRQTNLSAKHQRLLTREVKRARDIALLPYSRED